MADPRAVASAARFGIQGKHAPDRAFLRFLPIIERGAADDRNFVKKAVNWALREIGKRSRALRDLTSPAVQRRLKR